ncbi:peptidoglycan DD-metalloendopeptidase family protein [Nitriliruptoraceae bacterium ZYF776]|nr:peptidoglycan DD-metalloendopeptidase family protein [Profundirhabdus halotolerans]
MPRLLRPVALVAALLMLSSAAAAQTPGGLESDLEERQRERAQVEQQLEDNERDTGTAQDRLAAADQDLADAEAELAEVQEAMAAAEQRRDEAREAATAARAELQDVIEELARSEAELEVIQEQFDLRVVGSFKRGSTHNELTVIQQMLAADDIADALAQRPFLSAVLDADRRLVDEVRDLVALVESQRADAERLRRTADSEAATAAAAAEEIAEQLVAQEALTEQVAERREARDAALEALREDRAAIEDHLAGLDAESQRIEDQLAAIAAEQAAEEAARRAAEEAARAAAEQAEQEAQQPSPGDGGGGDGSDDGGETSPPPSSSPPPSGGGGWTRPTSGHVTSPYGPRWGRMHNGVDLAGSVGTGVVAARGGTVVHVTSSCHPTSSPGCGGGFGNYVTIAHDDGLATVYAHLSSVSVGVGQPVSAGQSVGAVGNSGNSTGPHLHFEVRQGGSPRDPCGYISC